MGHVGLSPSEPTRSRARAAAAASLGVLLTLFTGCASPGPPLPPSLHLPERPSRVQARRIGDRVELSWTTSAESTDGGELRGPITAVICRGALMKPAGPPPAKLPFCDPVLTRVVTPGESRLTETLPAVLLQGAPHTIFYEVELRNAQQRSAGVSAPLYVAAGAAPAPVGTIRLDAEPRGITVRWTPANPGVVMRLTRTLNATRADSAAQKGPSSSPGAPVLPKTGAKKQTKTAEPVELEADLTHSDSGGLLDPTVLDGGTYTYVAQRTLPVTLNGMTLELQGEPSRPATITYNDVFPPTAPAGLVAIPGGGFGQPVSIDLSWDPSPEPKTRGYNVYRAEGTSGDWVRLNPELLPGTAFRDLHVAAGQRYRYRVTAVDGLGHESKPSAEVQETASAQ